MYLCSRFSLFW